MAACGAYALLHLYWAIFGGPAIVAKASVFPGGWVPVVPAALAAVATLVIATSERFRFVAAWVAVAAGAGMIAYYMLAWISVVMLMMVPFGVPMPMQDVWLLVLRVTGAGSAGLAIWAAVTVFRAVTVPGSRYDRTPWWGYLAGYLSLGGMAARMTYEVPEIVRGELSGPGGAGFILFVVLMMISGSLLPLALVHRWGRIWPRWVLPWAGRPVPRMLVLAPGLIMGAGLGAYFGIGGIGAMIIGRQSVDLPSVIMIGGYALWGLGLLVASASYARLTGSNQNGSTENGAERKAIRAPITAS